MSDFLKPNQDDVQNIVNMYGNRNNDLNEKFLPIGTIVFLKGAQKRLMITGFLMDGKRPNSDKEETFDYTGCIVPEGLKSNDRLVLFNHDQIMKIYNKGFNDEEGIKTLKDVMEFSRDIDKIKKYSA